MTPLHPHWHSDDSQEQDVPVNVVDGLSAPADEPLLPTPVIRTASRKPAAVVGILLVGALGYGVFLKNGGSLPAQISNDAPVSLRLTAEGAVPESLNVTPGNTVEVTNEDGIPHVLSFQDLTVDGKPLETSPIFPGSTLKMLIPASVKAGTFAYVSKTSDLSGKIVIGSVAPAAASSTSSVSSMPAPLAAAIANTTDTTTDAPTVPRTITTSIPINFHTVDSPGQGPVEALHTGAPLTVITQHKPITNTNSGPATWILVFAVTAVLLLVTRKAFR